MGLSNNSLFAAAVVVAFLGVAKMGFARYAAAWSVAWSIIESNQILQAFLVPTLVGGIAYVVRGMTKHVKSKLAARFYCSITMTNKDENFEAVINFIGKAGIVHTGSLMVETYKKKNATWKEMRSEYSLGVRTPPRLQYRPANNNDVHIIEYKGQQIVFSRTLGETVVTGYQRVPTTMETMTLSCWGRSNEVLKALLDDAVAAGFEDQTEELNVYVMVDSWCGSWEQALSKKPRALESVILDENLAADLVADARSFLQSAPWYQGAGIPYRRGYLLYGPPGCGKTSFCQALAGSLKLDVCMLTLANKGLDDNKLAECLRDAPSNAIILLEDVDAVFVERTLAASGGDASGVTFSGLLNALDGVASQEGRLFFMTTNHIEKLDPALVRPGRCDVKVEVKCASRQQMQLMFERFFPGESEKAATFASLLPDYEISMAQLQGHLLECKADPQQAIDKVPKLLHATKPAHVDRMTITEHLRRVGLETLAPLFQHFGYEYKSELKGLKHADVTTWDLELQIDKVTSNRLSLLLSGDEELMHQYQFADITTIKEMFLQAYPIGTIASQAADPPMGSLIKRGASQPVKGTMEDSEGEAFLAVVERARSGPKAWPSMRRAYSLGLAETAPRHNPEEVLAKRLCDKLSVDGRGSVSIWQLSWHLALYEGDPVGAVDNAEYMLAPLGRAHQPTWQPISTYEILRRMCLEEYAFDMEDAGYHSVEDLKRVTEDELKNFNFQPKQIVRFNAVMKAESKHPGEVFKALKVHRPRLLREFRAAYPLAPAAEAGQFALALSDESGRGKASLHQIHAHFDKHKDDSSSAATNAHDDLVKVERVRVEVPPPPPCTDWVHGWLEEAGFVRYAAFFTRQNLKTKEDLMMEPRATLEDLDKILMVKNMGDCRKIFHMIKNL